MFSSEYKGAEFRKFLNLISCRKGSAGNIKEVVEEGIKYYSDLNPEAMLTTSGDRVFKPSTLLFQELKDKKKKFGDLNEKDELLLQSLIQKL